MEIITNEIGTQKLKLYKLVKELGYCISSTPSKNGRVFHGSKVIQIQLNDSLEELFDLSHELGHCFQYNRRLLLNRNLSEKYKTISNNKILTIIEEFEAWVIGYILLKIQHIPSKGFLKHSWNRWKSYLSKLL